MFIGATTATNAALRHGGSVHGWVYTSTNSTTGNQALQHGAIRQEGSVSRSPTSDASQSRRTKRGTST